MASKIRATLDDLRQIEGKAEIINGEIVLMSPTGWHPGRAAKRICDSLEAWITKDGVGFAVPDNQAFRVNLPHRETFSPDAAYYVGPDPGMKFFEGAPVFAVEVRSENDYGPTSEKEMLAKRADYFAAGTQVVWDVDLLGDEVIKAYHAGDPERPTIFRRGQQADAGAAVPGWTFDVDNLFAG